MGSDHAPVICSLNLNKQPLECPRQIDLRFNFSRADWAVFKEEIDKQLGDKVELETCNDVNLINEIFSNSIIEAAGVSVPKFAPKNVKSYPPHIIDLICSRRVVRKNIKKANLADKNSLITQYNKLTKMYKKEVKDYTLKKWSHFLSKLGPHPASSSQFWQIINKTRSQKSSSSIPI